MTDTVQDPSAQLTAQDAAAIFADWLAAFAAAVRDGSATDLSALFLEGASWRDFMAFPWDFHHTVGRDETISRFLELAKLWEGTGFTASPEQPPVVGGGRINAFFDFTTKNRADRGYVMLVQNPVGDGGRFVASVLQTQVVGLLEYPERTRHHRREGKVYGVVPGRTRWAADRRQEASFEDSDPAVLVLGAGHNGLAIAARLGALDVPTLVIDKEQRVGDTWRKRYSSLALHSTVFGDHLPYLPLPPTWTAHTPKDKFADLLESYATLMDINVWTGTTFLSGHYDATKQCWAIQVRRADGSIRTAAPAALRRGRRPVRGAEDPRDRRAWRRSRASRRTPTSSRTAPTSRQARPGDRRRGERPRARPRPARARRGRDHAAAELDVRHHVRDVPQVLLDAVHRGHAVLARLRRPDGLRAAARAVGRVQQGAHPAGRRGRQGPARRARGPRVQDQLRPGRRRHPRGHHLRHGLLPDRHRRVPAHRGRRGQAQAGRRGRRGRPAEP